MISEWPLSPEVAAFFHITVTDEDSTSQNSNETQVNTSCK